MEINRIDPEVVKLSKSLSWLFRQDLKADLKIDDGGFVNIDDILQLKKFQGYKLHNFLKVVDENDKRRFSVRCKDDGNTFQIRANVYHGHNLPLSSEGLLTVLGTDEVPPQVYYGTYFVTLDMIRSEGIKKVNPNHIMFSSMNPSNGQPTQGIRKNSEVFIVVNTFKAIDDGVEFFSADNFIIYSAGDLDGVILPKYFREIWQLRPLKRLF